MSRYNGTCLVSEKELFLRETPAYETWTSYNEKKNSVKAFMIEVTEVSNGRVYGHITELDYEKHIDYLAVNAQKTNEVQLTFQDSIRKFSIEDYTDNYADICNRYGSVVNVTFLPEQPQLYHSKLLASREELEEEIIFQDFEYFHFNFQHNQFLPYRYTAHDREFVNSQEIEQLLKYGLNLYALSKKSEEYIITTFEEYCKLQDKDMLFCTSKDERALLKYLKYDITPLFTEEEYEVIQESVVELAKDNKIENQTALNSILYKLRHLLPKYNTENQIYTDEHDLQR